MTVLVLDLTANKRRFENRLSEEIRRRVSDLGFTVELRQLPSTEALIRPPYFYPEVNQINCDWAIVVAHGAALDNPVDFVGVEINDRQGIIELGTAGYDFLNTPGVISSLFDNVRRAHKLLIVCSGLTGAAAAALNTGYPGLPLEPGRALIGSLRTVFGDEALIFTEEFFRELSRTNDIDRALEHAKRSVGDTGGPKWLRMPDLQVQDYGVDEVIEFRRPERDTEEE